MPWRNPTAGGGGRHAAGSASCARRPPASWPTGTRRPRSATSPATPAWPRRPCTTTSAPSATCCGRARRGDRRRRRSVAVLASLGRRSSARRPIPAPPSTCWSPARSAILCRVAPVYDVLCHAAERARRSAPCPRQPGRPAARSAGARRLARRGRSPATWPRRRGRRRRRVRPRQRGALPAARRRLRLGPRPLPTLARRRPAPPAAWRRRRPIRRLSRSRPLDEPPHECGIGLHAHEDDLHAPSMTASTRSPQRRRHVPDRPATSRRGVRGRAPRPARRSRPRRAAP